MIDARMRLQSVRLKVHGGTETAHHRRSWPPASVRSIPPAAARNTVSPCPLPSGNPGSSQRTVARDSLLTFSDSEKAKIGPPRVDWDRAFSSPLPMLGSADSFVPEHPIPGSGRGQEAHRPKDSVTQTAGPWPCSGRAIAATESPLRETKCLSPHGGTAKFRRPK